MVDVSARTPTHPVVALVSLAPSGVQAEAGVDDEEEAEVEDVAEELVGVAGVLPPPQAAVPTAMRRNTVDRVIGSLVLFWPRERRTHSRGRRRRLPRQ